ncbi:[Fe-Fe] hydrogenase large subunit C-terminal domain-containing protein [Sporomusa aerivorans]|uniref:[Fe-Fe] hydrogenase large subunit C-terminal domain-containing protein n=1 Tax=Sporomusa aerivorans TaxID=204936 RepID=UPI00352AD0CC
MVVSKRHCTGCRLCVGECPVSPHETGEEGPFIAGSGCVDCGACLPQCPAAAIDYADDTERFISDVRNGVPIALLAAPVAINSFADYRQVFGYLRSLGVRSFHNVLLRADITIWAYTELMRCNEQAAFLSSPCAAVTDYIRRHKPNLKPYLIPVHSPVLCTVIYLRKYRQLTDRLAFLSPCIAKRKEIKALNPQGYNVTISRLQQYLASHNIDLSRYAAADFDDRTEGAGLTLGVYGGVSESIAAHLPGRRFVKIGGPDKVYRWLDEYEQMALAKEPLPNFAELYNCRAGCEGGTGISERQKAGLAPVDSKWSKLAPAAAVKSRQSGEHLFSVFKQTLQLPDFMT